ncbi:peptidase S1 [Asticcacaulis sp. AC460]|uniref:S1C family serine protease n=1 Tax=Asticcacaulis sp. AC460 TaxID=1282360 RepID=UPI0003C3E8B1|nr:serine protease [Asticcacaulis sp. AC460]ESQ92708.1 peptidase S1 [Asticcacaulis sp. AC460]
MAAAMVLSCLMTGPVMAQSSAEAAAALSIDPDLAPVNSTKALKTSEQAVVRVLVIYRGFGGQPLDTVGMGSGFVVAPGYIVTNFHVVEVPPEASSADIYIVPHKDSGAAYQPVQLVKHWIEGDLALLQAPGLKIPPIKLYLTPYKNERVVSMGYPDITDHLLNRSGTALLEPADAYVTQGSIALFASTNPDGARVDTLFHTAPINHGNSGGPLLNECGQVVGVNTWTAPSTLSAGGDLDVAAGQFVATHVSALNTFLNSADVKPQTTSSPCYAKSEDEIVKDDALTRALAKASAAQEERLGEQRKAEADRALMERLQLGAMVVLSLLVLVLIGLIVRREMRHRAESHHKEPEAPTAWSEPVPEKAKPAKVEKVKPVKPAPVAKAPVKHPIPWGWIALGVMVVVVIIAFLVNYSEMAKRLAPAKASATVAAQGVIQMVCQVDKSASSQMLKDAGPIDFEFDALHACVNGKTAYERQDDGSLVRYMVSDSSPIAARISLSSDGTTFERREYRLEAETYRSYLAQRAALGSLRCVTKTDPGKTAQLADNLAKVRTLSMTVLTMPPESHTVWRCTKKAG